MIKKITKLENVNLKIREQKMQIINVLDIILLLAEHLTIASVAYVVKFIL